MDARQAEEEEGLDLVPGEGSGDDAPDECSRIVPATDAGSTKAPWPLAEAFMELFGMSSMSQARRAVRTGQVFVNGTKRKAEYKVCGGDRLEWRQRTEGAPTLDVGLVPEELRKAFQVVYENDDLAVIWKPEGVDTTGGEGGGWSALRISHHFLRPSSARGAYRRARAVHRLDAPTAGLVCLAKTQPAHKALAAAFEERRVHKKYLALLMGPRLEPPSGRVETPLRCLLPGRSELQEAVTEYEELTFTPAPSELGGGISTVALRPKTGRTHQLRRHAAHTLGRPILGDAQYGSDRLPERALGCGLFLCAVELEMPRLDGSGTLLLRVEEPAKFEAARREAEERAAQPASPSDAEGSAES